MNPEKWPLFCGTAWSPCLVTPWRGFWFRIFGWGLHVSTKPRTEALFSERYGCTKPLYLFGIRIQTLAR